MCLQIAYNTLEMNLYEDNSCWHVNIIFCVYGLISLTVHTFYRYSSFRTKIDENYHMLEISIRVFDIFSVADFNKFVSLVINR